MKYPRYPAYKDSGVEWIGEIPKEWNAVKLGIFARANSGKRPPLIETDGRIPIYGANGVIGYTNFSMNNELKLLVGRVGSSGAVNIAYPPCWISDNVLIISHNSNVLNFKFLYYSLGLLDYSIEKSNTAQPLITSSALLAKKIPIPPIEDQAKIENFLDGVSKEIGKLIKDIMKNVELLKEKRQAIITKAVTKGLDPNVQMKDSDVEWIGEIPEHWKLKRLKYVVKLVNDKSERETTQIALENIESWSGKYLVTDDEFKGGGIRFQSGDILFGKLRPYLAKVYLAAFSGLAVGDFFVLRSFSNVESKFLFNWLINREFINIVNSATYGAKMPRVDWGFMGELLVAIPPKEEQIKICDTIKVKTSQIDALITKQYDMIEHLKEYKTSLITQAVTGKIDVRCFAVPTDSNSA